MNRTREEIMQLYSEYERLIHTTVHRRYSDPGYMNKHFLTKDDLMQYGRIGLYNACKTYNPSAGASMQNHAIRCIIGTILNESKKDSLSNINNRSNELIDRTSLDQSQTNENGEETSLHDSIESYELGYDEIEIQQLLNFLESGTSERLAKIVRMRIEGYTFQEIGKKLGASKQAVEQMLNRNRGKIEEMLNIERYSLT